MSELQLPPTTTLNTDIDDRTLDLKETSANCTQQDFDNTLAEFNTQDQNT